VGFSQQLCRVKMEEEGEKHKKRSTEIEDNRIIRAEHDDRSVDYDRGVKTEKDGIPGEETLKGANHVKRGEERCEKLEVEDSRGKNDNQFNAALSSSLCLVETSRKLDATGVNTPQPWSSALVEIDAKAMRPKPSNSYSLVATSRENEGTKRSRESSTRTCSVPDCTSNARGRVYEADAFGEAGIRCYRHGKRCNVPDCNASFAAHVREADAFGEPGPRCTRHGAGRHGATPTPRQPRRTNASMDALTAMMLGKKDAPGSSASMNELYTQRNSSASSASAEPCTALVAFGSTDSVTGDTQQLSHPGTRSGGGRKQMCNFPLCKYKAYGTVAVDDRFGPPGPRCGHHGGAGTRQRVPSSTPATRTNCGVQGCLSRAQSRRSVGDSYGPPGPRCFRHGGGIRCVIEGCPSGAASRVVDADEFGPPGGRCSRHGGRKRVR